MFSPRGIRFASSSVVDTLGVACLLAQGFGVLLRDISSALQPTTYSIVKERFVSQLVERYNSGKYCQPLKGTFLAHIVTFFVHLFVH